MKLNPGTCLLLMAFAGMANTACATVIIDDYNAGGSRISIISPAPIKPAAITGQSGQSGPVGPPRDPSGMPRLSPIPSTLAASVMSFDGSMRLATNGDAPMALRDGGFDDRRGRVNRAKLPLWGNSQLVFQNLAGSGNSAGLSMMPHMASDVLRGKSGTTFTPTAGTDNSVAFTSFSGTARLNSNLVTPSSSDQKKRDQDQSVTFEDVAVITPEPATISLLVSAAAMMGMCYLVKRKGERQGNVIQN